MKGLALLASVLVIVGALNWGLVALAQFDLVAALFGLRFGEVSPLTAVVYGLVGLSGLFLAVHLLIGARSIPSVAGSR